MSANNYKECVPSDDPDYFDGIIRPSIISNNAEEKDKSGIIVAF